MPVLLGIQIKDIPTYRNIFCCLTVFTLLFQLEDVEGYPRNICSTCKITLDMLCEFVDTYKRSCNLLRESLAIVKTEVDFGFSSHDDLGVQEDCPFSGHDNLNEQIAVKIENIKSIVTVSNTNKENNNDASQILEKLKPVPGLKITKVSAKEHLKEKVNKKIRTTKKAASEHILKTKTSKTKAKIIKPPQRKEKALVEIENDIENHKKEMEMKLLKVKEENTALCNYCGVVFDRKEKLTCHIKSQHMNTKITCTICSKGFLSKAMLKRHIKRVHSEKTLQCEYCKNMFSDRGPLNSHIKAVHKKHLLPKKLYPCKYCNKIYKASHARIAHERTIHTGKIN